MYYGLTVSCMMAQKQIGGSKALCLNGDVIAGDQILYHLKPQLISNLIT